MHVNVCKFMLMLTGTGKTLLAKAVATESFDLKRCTNHKMYKVICKFMLMMIGIGKMHRYARQCMQIYVNADRYR